MKIYHNPRCSNSRQTLALLQENGVDPEVVEYLKDLLTTEDLRELIGFLGIEPLALVRKNESVWKEQFKEKELSDKIGLKTEIQFNNNGSSGSLKLFYSDLNQLDEIMKRLKK